MSTIDDARPQSSRRAFLAAATAAAIPPAIAGPALASNGPDADLMVLCQRALDAHRAYNEACVFCEDHPALPALADIENESAYAIADIPARSRDGLSAKARVLKARMPKASNSVDLWPYADESDALTWSLAQDVLALNGGEA